MLEADVIEEVREVSPWVSNLVVVRISIDDVVVHAETMVELVSQLW